MQKNIVRQPEETDMSDYETVQYGQDGAVATITIFRPDAMNSFNTELRKDLLTAFEFPHLANPATWRVQTIDVPTSVAPSRSPLVVQRDLRRLVHVEYENLVLRLDPIGPPFVGEDIVRLTSVFIGPPTFASRIYHWPSADNRSA